MQENKRGFYFSKGGERQRRELNQHMERLISEKKDADRFLSILAPVFEGVFFVNLETDTVRQIFIPSYFQEMLKECGDKYRGPCCCMQIEWWNPNTLRYLSSAVITAVLKPCWRERRYLILLTGKRMGAR